MSSMRLIVFAWYVMAGVDHLFDVQAVYVKYIFPVVIGAFLWYLCYLELR